MGIRQWILSQLAYRGYIETTTTLSMYHTVIVINGYEIVGCFLQFLQIHSSHCPYENFLCTFRQLNNYSWYRIPERKHLGFGRGSVLQDIVSLYKHMSVQMMGKESYGLLCGFVVEAFVVLYRPCKLLSNSGGRIQQDCIWDKPPTIGRSLKNITNRKSDSNQTCTFSDFDGIRTSQKS